MPKHLQRDVEQLKKALLGVGSLVDHAIHLATTALLDRRPSLAQEVVAGDEEIDRREVVIEEDCLKILALHQPVAFDLRFIVAVLKVNNELERMADLAVNIAERALTLAALPPLPISSGFERMVQHVKQMVAGCLRALIEQDTGLAQEVLRADDEVDRTHRQMFTDMQELMRRDPDNIERATCMLSASRYLERIADQATNIAEDVIFLVQGEIVRHRAPPR